MSNQKYNVQTILLGEDEDKDLMKIECFSNRRDEISVRLAKILRTEINKIQS